MAGSVASMFAFWAGGVGNPRRAGVKSLVAFWMGGATNDPNTPAPVQPTATIQSYLGYWGGGFYAPGTTPIFPGTVQSMLGFWMGGVVSGPAASPPTTPPETLISAAPGGVGVRAWRDHYPRPKLPKKKKKLVDELDEILLELRSRVAEEPEIDRGPELNLLESSYNQALHGELSLVQIQLQIGMAQAMMREMDDEDALLLLAIH